MKTNKKNLIQKRQIIEKKLRQWIALRNEKAPPSGWIKAIRDALGLNTRQLAELLGVEHSTILRLEEREAKGKVTLELIEKVANVMNCKLVYAIVPQAPFNDLESIIEERARELALSLIQKVEHSMQLESQGTDAADLPKQVERLAYDLKSKMDTRLWNKRIGKVNKVRNK